MAEARRIPVETPRYVAELNTLGGVFSSFKLKGYRVAKENIDWGDVIPPVRRFLPEEELDTDALENMAPDPLIGNAPLALRFVGEDSLTRRYRRTQFTADRDAVDLAEADAAPRTLVLRGGDPDGLTVVKRLTFHPDSFIVDYEIALVNYGSQALPLRVASLFGEGPRGAHEPTGYRAHRGPIWRTDVDSLETEDPDELGPGLRVREPNWVGITDTYFITAVEPLSPISHAFYEGEPVQRAGDEVWVAAYGMELPQVALAPGKMVTGAFKLYLGPKRVSEMEKFGGQLETSLDLTLDILSQPMLAMMRWFYGFTGNYGVSIILLTVVVRVVLFPLTYRGMLNIKRMQKLQPRMVALREKYKNDKERLNREMIAMYRKHKMNPLGGCLPIALQLPIFFALYTALLGAIELRHEPFMLWITDLSEKDGLYITPLLMGGSMLLQQKMTPTAMDPTQAKIMMWMPLIFMFFMMSFPSGLVLYWLTSNTLSIVQQIVINRIKIPEPAED